jgi:hypothetical protein
LRGMGFGSFWVRRWGVNGMKGWRSWGMGERLYQYA